MTRIVLAAPGRPYDLLLVCAIAGVTVLLSITGARSVLLTVLAFFCVYFSPGYALVSALFPGRKANVGHLLAQESAPESEISGLERLAASVVLSLLVFALGGIGLAWTPDGLTEGLVLAEVLTVNIALSALAMYRRFQLPKEEELVLALELGKGRGRLNRAEMAILAVASAGVVLAALAGAGLLGGGVGVEPYTEFSITGPDGSLGTLPQSLTAGKNGTVLVTFENRMGQEEEYDLTVGLMREGAFQNQTSLDWDVVHSLVPGDAYQFNVNVPDEGRFSDSFTFGFASPGQYRVMFELSFGDETQELWLLVAVT